MCCDVSTMDPYGRILDYLDRSRYFFFQIAPQLYSRGWVDPVPDPLLLRKYDSVGNRTRDLWMCSQEIWPRDHRGGPNKLSSIIFCNLYFNICFPPPPRVTKLFLLLAFTNMMLHACIFDALTPPWIYALGDDSERIRIWLKERQTNKQTNSMV
jgi:hypothetical protein